MGKRGPRGGVKGTIGKGLADILAEPLAKAFPRVKSKYRYRRFLTVLDDIFVRMRTAADAADADIKRAALQREFPKKWRPVKETEEEERAFDAVRATDEEITLMRQHLFQPNGSLTHKAEFLLALAYSELLEILQNELDDDPDDPKLSSFVRLAFVADGLRWDSEDNTASTPVGG
jgi:hypothetical protein